MSRVDPMRVAEAVAALRDIWPGDEYVKPADVARWLDRWVGVDELTDAEYAEVLGELGWVNRTCQVCGLPVVYRLLAWRGAGERWSHGWPADHAAQAVVTRGGAR